MPATRTAKAGESLDPFCPAGLLLSPLTAVPAAGIHFALWHWDWASADAAWHAALVILPLSYTLSLFVGLPYLYGLRRHGLLNLASIAVGGLLVGLAVGFLVGIALFPLWDWYARFFYLSLGGLCGFVVAVTYWLAWRLTGGRQSR